MHLVLGDPDGPFLVARRPNLDIRNFAVHDPFVDGGLLDVQGLRNFLDSQQLFGVHFKEVKGRCENAEK
jgi:hypothetical protein